MLRVSKLVERVGLFARHARPLFIVSLDYKKPLGEVEKHLPEHRKFLEEGYKSGVFVASGRKEPRTGGIIIASARDRETLEKQLEQDPFKKHSIADYTVTEFKPTMHNEAFRAVAENDTAQMNRP